MFPHRYPRPKPRTLVVSTILLVGAALTFAAASPVTAQGNAGTIKVHDGPTADPPTRNEPHVSGDFYIEGSNMAADDGDLLFYHWPPTGDMELVLETTWEGDDGSPEVHFVEGPFELPCGHYRVFAYNGDGPEDPTEPQPGGAKKKTFWVECEDEPEPEPTPTGTTTSSTSDTGTSTSETETSTSETETSTSETETSTSETETTAPEPEPGMECPSDVDVAPNADGTVTLTFTPAGGSDGTNIYRADGDGDFEYLTTVGADVTTYTDATTVAGNVYAYLLTGLYGVEESEDCDVVEVSAIPVFPSALAFGMATVLGAGVYLAMTGRRKA
jgi:hypothetical protein